MSTPKFADVHNFITFLVKPTEFEGFEQIIDLLNANPIKYALTVNLTIYISCIEQFWVTANAKNINGEAQIYAKVDGKKVIISEATIKRDLKFEDEGGVDYLSNEVIFEQFPLMGGLYTNDDWNEVKQLLRMELRLTLVRMTLEGKKTWWLRLGAGVYDSWKLQDDVEELWDEFSKLEASMKMWESFVEPRHS
uniref:Uncharacterized protein n=1 Tax=Tanacetum cinerariifolium TaxID=118510 RepID=A0A6L2P291_TANCI|nr:hypothetical protein [Tanacetum cinerariifolium]